MRALAILIFFSIYSLALLYVVYTVTNELSTIENSLKGMGNAIEEVR